MDGNYAFEKDASNSPFEALILRFADVNKDGQEDMLITVKDKSTKTKTTVLFQNMNCEDVDTLELSKALEDDFDKVKHKKSCRYFAEYPFKKLFKEVNKEASYVTAFFDYGELG